MLKQVRVYLVHTNMINILVQVLIAIAFLLACFFFITRGFEYL